jgi:hypothetical protein
LLEDNSYGLPQGVYNYFQIQTNSSFFNADYYYWSNSSRITDDDYYQIRREKITTVSVVENIVLIYPATISKQLGLYGNVITVIGYQENLTLNSNSYSKVIIINQIKDQTEGDFITNFYFANNYGIIRKEIPGRNEVWNLMRFNIVQ